MTATTYTAEQVAEQLNNWAFAGQSGVCVYARLDDGSYAGGAWYSTPSRPPVTDDCRRLPIRRGRWTADEVDAWWVAG